MAEAKGSQRTYPDRIPEPEYGSNMKPKRVYPDGTAGISFFLLARLTSTSTKVLPTCPVPSVTNMPVPTGLKNLSTCNK
jgi:hypothetical protein